MELYLEITLLISLILISQTVLTRNYQIFPGEFYLHETLKSIDEDERGQ